MAGFLRLFKLETSSLSQTVGGLDCRLKKLNKFLCIQHISYFEVKNAGTNTICGLWGVV